MGHLFGDQEGERRCGMSYDSRPDTWEHINAVRGNVTLVVAELMQRALHHDRSKIVEDVERNTFDRVTEQLHGLDYGSAEYKAALAGMKPALDSHYAKNRHHPEHFVNGISGMSLVDVVEMLCDWEAATHRHATGDLAKSIELNQSRFGYTDETKQLLLNTAKDFGWIRP